MKAPQAKGKDEYRKGWKERYFVLKQKSLFYYKKKDELREQDKLELANAIVSLADEITDEDFTFKVGLAKQNFLYLKASSAAEREDWIHGMIASGASYMRSDGSIAPSDAVMEKAEEVKQDVPEYQMAIRLSWGIMYKESSDDLYHERFVASVDPEKGVLHMIRDGTIVKSLRIKDMENVIHSTRSEDRLPSGKKLVPVKFDILKGQKSLKQYTFFLGAAKDAKEISDALLNCIEDEVAQLFTRLQYPPIEWGYIEVRFGDTTTRYQTLWAVLDTGKISLFYNTDARYPLWVISLEGSDIVRNEKFDISIQANLLDYGLKFKKSAVADVWFKALVLAQKSYEERVQEQFQLGMDEETKKKLFSAVVYAEDEALKRLGLKALAHGPTFVACSGLGKDGQLGNRTKEDYITPSEIEFLTKKAVSYVAASRWGAASFAVCADGTLYAWGKGLYGELGCGESRTRIASPNIVSEVRAMKIVRIACGKSHTLALTSEGDVLSWGDGKFGQLGHGFKEGYMYPKQIDDIKASARDIYAGGDFSGCLIGNDRELFVWGANGRGQLGLGDKENRLTMSKCLINRKGALQSVSFGSDFAAAVVCGKVYAWGNNEYGKLGTGDGLERDSPTKISYFQAKEVEISEVSCGDTHALALASDGSVYAWGKGDVNCLQKEKDKLQPSRIKLLTNIKSIYAGVKHSFFIDKENILYGYGSNYNGELMFARSSQFPEFVQSALKTSYVVAQVVTGLDYSLALIQGNVSEKIFDKEIIASEFNTRAKKIDKTEGDDVPGAAVGDAPMVGIGELLDMVNLMDQKSEKIVTKTVPKSEAVALPAPAAGPDYGPEWKQAIDKNSGRICKNR